MTAQTYQLVRPRRAGPGKVQRHWMLPAVPHPIGGGILLAIRHNHVTDVHGSGWQTELHVWLDNGERRVSNIYAVDNIVEMPVIGITVIIRAHRHDPTGRPAASLVEISETRGRWLT